MFKLSRSYLEKYPAVHERLEVSGVLRLIGEWLEKLEAGGFTVNPLTPENAPRLALLLE